MQQPTQHMQSGQGYMTVPVGDNGTIQTSLYIDADWWPGSRHILYVLGQNGKLLVRKQFFVRNTLSAPTLVLCSNSKADNSSAAVNLGPTVEGDSKTVTTVFNLCTQGSGNVDWTRCLGYAEQPLVTPEIRVDISKLQTCRNSRLVHPPLPCKLEPIRLP